MLLCIVYIGVMAFYSMNDIVQQTQPANNSSFLANQSSQTNDMINSMGALLPGVLLLGGAWVVLKVFGQG
jgi:hypothetical protein